jgi:APA family basic amino acid/polyamine antiporter
LSLLCALLLIWTIVALNIRSLESSSRFQVVSTLIKILPLVFMMVLGFTHMEPANLPELNPTDLHPAALLATVTTLVMWSFVGIETASVPADNMVEPEKTIPRVLVAAVLTILTIYLLVSLAVALLVPADELIQSSAPFALAASKVMGPLGAALITIGALVSTLGSLNANTLTAGNVALAAARDNLLPAQFKTLSETGTPRFAYVVSGLFVSGLLILNYTKGLVAAFTFMAMLSTLSTLMAYAFCAVSEFYFLSQTPQGQSETEL